MIFHSCFYYILIFFSSKILHFQVPHNAVPGSYKLKVEGNFEGDIGGSGFRNETDLHFSERFLTILIQTNQLVYNLEQTSKLSKMLLKRIFCIQTNIKIYTV